MVYQRDRQVRRPSRAAAKVGELDHRRRAMFVDRIRQVANPRHDLVLVGKDVVEHRRTVQRHRRRPGGHAHGNPGLGPRRVIGGITLLRHSVFGIGRFMAGGHDPVAQGQMLDLVGLQERVV